MSTNKIQNVVIVSNFHEENSTSRSNLAYRYFMNKGCNTVVLYSSFSHSMKRHRKLSNTDFIPLKAIGYNSSFSLQRIMSYIIFSYKTFIYLSKSKVDIVYYNLPPNMLALSVALSYKKKRKYIVDILDLWPESLPINNSVISTLIIEIFGKPIKGLRKLGLTISDYSITESKFFSEKLGLMNCEKSSTVSLKKVNADPPAIERTSKEISIIYIGNIGLIYDFKSLIKLIRGLSKHRKTTLYIIGGGPREASLLRALKESGIRFINYGVIFDEEKKKKIIEPCWFGFNGFKDTTEVALSYKSIDYLSYGVPLINSTKSDTADIVNTNKIGFNYSAKDIELLIDKLATISYNEIVNMKTRSFDIFSKMFSEQAYYNEMDAALSETGIFL